VKSRFQVQFVVDGGKQHKTEARVGENVLATRMTRHTSSWSLADPGFSFGGQVERRSTSHVLPLAALFHSDNLVEME